MENIKTFQREYKSSDDAVYWYTKESFLYLSVNRALRSENIDELYIHRFFITDLCAQLLRIYKQQEQLKHGQDKSIVYRGQFMYHAELEKLKSNAGTLISTNSFFSTTTNINVARIFANSCHNMIGVLFQIEIDNNTNSVIYATITKHSICPDEEEVLFHIGAVFRINSISYDNNLKLWKIYFKRAIAVNDLQTLVDRKSLIFTPVFID